MRQRRGKLSLPIHGQEVSVPDTGQWHCPKCREVVLDFYQSRRLRGRALEIYRRKYRLLSPQEIRTLRERCGLTRPALARLLRLEAEVISRWESGRNVQTASMDMLLRLLRDLPGSLSYLRKHAA